jgi:hypothetical protein
MHVVKACNFTKCLRQRHATLQNACGEGMWHCKTHAAKACGKGMRQRHAISQNACGEGVRLRKTHASGVRKHFTWPRLTWNLYLHLYKSVEHTFFIIIPDVSFPIN